MKINKTVNKETIFSLEYEDFPADGIKTASITEWDNGEGFDVFLGDTHLEISNQEISVLEILFANTRLIK